MMQHTDITDIEEQEDTQEQKYKIKKKNYVPLHLYS